MRSRALFSRFSQRAQHYDPIDGETEDRTERGYQHDAGPEVQDIGEHRRERQQKGDHI